jgi:hypothetical protein
VTSGGIVLNDATHTLVLGSSTGTYAPDPTGSVTTVTLTRHGSTAAQDIITASGIVGTDPHTITASVPYANANPGLYDVDVTQGPTEDACSSCVQVAAFRPAVTSVSPANLGEGTTGGGFQNFVITGQGFTKGLYTQCITGSCTGPSVAAYKAGTTTSDPNVVLTQTFTGANPPACCAPTATTPTTITLRVAVTGTDATSYADDVVVINSDGKSATCAGCLTILPRPTIASVLHTLSDGNGENKLGLNAQHETVIVRGDHFPADSLVFFVPPAGAPSGSKITTATPTAPTADGAHQKITLTDVSTTAANVAGTWEVVVASASQHSTSDESPLPVDAAPSATGVTYPDATVARYGQGAQNVRFDVLVDHTLPFVAGSGVTPHTLVSFTSLPVGATVVSQVASLGNGSNDNIVQVTLDLPENAGIADYTFSVVNPDGGRSAVCDNSTLIASNTCVLSVGAGPHVSSINPNTEAGGFSGPAVITGTNFHTGGNKVHVRVGPAATPFFDGDATAAADGKSISIPTLSVPANANPANVDVVVINKDDVGTSTGAGLFHVANLTAGSPSPNQGTNDAPVSVTITGTQISPSATVSLVRVGVPSIPGTSVQVNAGHTSMTATFNLTDMSPGAYDLLVTNPANDSHPGTAGCSQCFTVVASPPTISTVAPTSLGAGAVNELITVTGTHIFAGATMTFSNTHVHLVGTPTVTPTGTITQHISIDEGTAADAADTVKVTNTDDQSVTHLFAINAGPKVTSIAPASRAAGSPTFSLTVNGSNFVTGATLVFSAPSITATNYVVTATKITADVTIPAGVVPAGSPVPVHLTVVNPDHGRGTSPTDLTADPQPTIDHFSPAATPAGTSFTLHAFGANFLTGATVTSADPALTITNSVFKNAGEVDATVQVAANAAKGNHTVKVTNTDAGAVSHALAVIVKPTAPTSLTVQAGQQSLQLSWAAPTDNGGGPITSYTAKLTKHGNASPSATATTPNGATFSHTFSGLTNGQLYDVSVVATNGAGNGPAASGSGTPAPTSKLTIHRSAAMVTAGHALTLSGVLTRANHSALGGVSVRVFRTFDGGTAHKIKTVTTNASGHWTFTSKPTHNANYYATFAGNAANANATSPTTRVLVASAVLVTSPRNGSSSTSATPLVVTGHVTPNKAGKVVRLYRVTASGLKLVASAKLSGHSKFHFSVHLARGSWRLLVKIGRTTGNAAGQSATLKVNRT